MIYAKSCYCIYMKYIILAQNINTAKKGLNTLKWNIEVFEISKKTILNENINEYKDLCIKYERILDNQDITLAEVDEILSFIDKSNNYIIKVLT